MKLPSTFPPPLKAYHILTCYFTSYANTEPSYHIHGRVRSYMKDCALIWASAGFTVSFPWNRVAWLPQISKP